ncbi:MULTISPECIES: DNA polymerase III subunit gamma/tau [unclassified Acinetobacter]|uniref:DNA polymerase III subunit gamma/tau n=1 Tax=unclassified Acinetobacter TaxID=196816 RepID=UPI002577D3C3|nr:MULTISPECIES: DNA polymerase III subunit gamma/tau [unclassified Acinetobacter]MDM1765368.1 DNA polymerase III subunit gamma/tau [Acinetobacter sp. 226-1]MDM1768873.1 DNA polymerase III subunit gamma/tau [Acinetobacter sp. 226-4]
MYQVLARKYRPRNFNELVGQNHVSRALTSALDRGRLHHAYLFTGTRGVGKTTIARILAKCLNCETGVTSTPCEVCATCKAVNEGRFIDLIEIDAASRTKVEDTRELLDNVPYAPTQGRFKVYLIDEVHMLSTHSFNALLKTLEEPPAHVKFLFATTDPQKLPITVISRCLQFTLRPLAVDEITHHLTDILAKESIQSEQDAIWQIAESAQGSLRDALSLTDQAIAYGQGAIHHQDVKEMLGLIDRTIIYDLILAIHQNQRERVSQLLLQFRQQALDVSLVLDQFISTLHELAMLQYLPDLSLKYSAEINKKIMTLSQLVSAQDIQLYYQIACKGRADLQLAVTQEQGFEMTVLRLLAFRPLQANEIVVSEPRTVQSSLVTAQPIEQNPESETKPDIQEQYDSEQNHFVEHVDDHQVQTASTLSHIEHSPESIAPVAEQLEYVVPTSTSATPNTQEATSAKSANMEQAQDLSIGIEPETLSLQQTENIEAVNEIQNLQDTDELALTSFGADFSENVAITNTAVTEDVFFLATEMDEAKPVVQLHEVVDVGTESITKTQPQNQVAVEIEQDKNHSQQTPQDILQLAPQQLEGEWDVNKWEYWFRNSDLSPAVQELAQHGLMIGMINGHSTFQISKQYENLLNQTQHALESSLKQQWLSTVFNVQYGEVESTTPFHMQNERKIQAYQRAEQMLHAEPAIKSLLQDFEGELQNIQLKV